MLLGNGYPSSTIDLIQKQQQQVKVHTEIKQPIVTTVIPYIKGIADKLRRIGNKYNVRTAFKSTETLREKLTKTKPFNETQSTMNCIYKIPCECERVYIGETGRALQIRVNEHKNLAKKGLTEKSRIVEHAWNENHKIQWSNAKIVAKESNSIKRKLKEAAYIALTQDPISQPSIELKSIWIPLLRKEMHATTSRMQ